MTHQEHEEKDLVPVLYLACIVSAIPMVALAVMVIGAVYRAVF